MVEAQKRVGEIAPRIFIETLIAQYGAWRVLRDVAAALMRPQGSAYINLSDLSTHLQRDIGLEQPRQSPRHWDIRF